MSSIFSCGSRREFEIGVTAAFADAGAVARHGNRTADDEVDLFHFIERHRSPVL